MKFGLPKNQSNQPKQFVSPFGKNIFIVNHKRRHRFVSTAKAGCTTLKYVTAIDDDLYEFAENEKIQSVHDKMGYAPNGSSLIAIDSDKHSDYTSLAVWRDPVERFISWYRDKVAHPYQRYIFLTALAVDNDIDRCIQFLEFELSKTQSEWIDEHLRPHHRYYNPEQIDVLVDMKDLNAYLESIGIEQDNQKTNTSAKKSELVVTDEQKQRIKELYQGDYDMYEQMKSKLWKPSS
jgi:hypothetical protein